VWARWVLDLCPEDISFSYNHSLNACLLVMRTCVLMGDCYVNLMRYDFRTTRLLSVILSDAQHPMTITNLMPFVPTSIVPSGRPDRDVHAHPRTLPVGRGRGARGWVVRRLALLRARRRVFSECGRPRHRTESSRSAPSARHHWRPRY
jgi:hypothetical protein